MPPACAIAIAILYSVTVSMAEATIGRLSTIERVMRVRISTSDGSTSERPGFQQDIVEGERLAQQIADHGHSQLQLARA